MKLKSVLAAAGVLGVVGVAAPVQADPTFMDRTEFNQVSAGQTKSKVETICGCSGQHTQYTELRNGNTYEYWWYSSHVGSTYIGYRWNSSTQKWIVGNYKYWCVAPYGNLGIPEGDCEKVQT